jgi:hypothetical protein
MFCRHGREQCEQCEFEQREQVKRFDSFVQENLRKERDQIERSPWWLKQMEKLYGDNGLCGDQGASGPSYRR